MINFGIVKPGSTLRIPFDTFAVSTGAPTAVTNFAVGDILIYKDGSTTERASTTGYTATTSFDAITGINEAVVDLSSDATADFFKAGSNYVVVISPITADGQTMSFVAATFTIGYENAVLNTSIATLASQTSFTLTTGPAEDDALNGMWAIVHDKASAVQWTWVQILDYTGSTKTVTLAATPAATFTIAAIDNFCVMGVMPLQPTVIGTRLDVSSGGEAGLDWANIGSPTTAQNLSGTSTKAVEPTVAGRTLDVSAGGEAGIDWANIGSPTTAQNLSATNIDVDQVVASVSGAVGSVTGAVGSVTGNVGGNVNGSVGSVATDGITSASLAASAITEIQSGLATSAEVAGVQSDTDNIQTRLPAALVGGRMDASVGEYQTGLTPLQPTVAGRTLDVTAGGGAGIDWANVENPTTALDLSATQILSADAVGTVAGSVGSVVGDVGGDVVGSVQGNVDGSVASVTGNLGGNVVGNVNGNVVGSTGSVVGNVGGNVVGSVASVVGNVGGNLVGNVNGVLSANANNGVSDALLARNIAGGSSVGRTVAQAMAALRNKQAIVAGVYTVYEDDDVTPLFEANVTTAAGDPLASWSPTT